MNKKSIISSVLAAGIALSATPTEVIAQETTGINNNEIVSSSTDNGGVSDVELYLRQHRTIQSELMAKFSIA